jgi:hypothetical protein
MDNTQAHGVNDLDELALSIIERMARAAYDAQDYVFVPWEEVSEAGQDSFRMQQKRVYDSLVELGVMPVKQSWAVRHPEQTKGVYIHDVDGELITSEEQASRSAFSFSPPDTVVTRYTTEWHEIKADLR